MVLVNGTDGVGIGWASKIPNYKPREIVENLLRMLEGLGPNEMVPWYKNFRGTISPLGNQKYVCHGEVARVGPSRLEITELPVGVWTLQYKEELEQMMIGGEIIDFEDYSTHERVGIVVKMDKEKLRKVKEEKGLHAFLKLQTTISTTSMVLFDRNGCIKTYETVQDILEEFFQLRVEFYGKRKAYIENMMTAEASKLSNQTRFLSEICKEQLQFVNKGKQEIIRDLISRNYDSDPVKKLSQGSSLEFSGPDFEYLLNMPLWEITLEKIEELREEKEKKEQDLEDLRATPKEDLWRHDLEEFLTKLDEVEETERQEASQGSGKGEWPLKVPKVLVPPKKQLHASVRFSEEIRMLMKERDVAFARKKRTKCARDVQYWKRLRNRVTGLVSKVNKAAAQDLMQDHGNGPRFDAKLVMAVAFPTKDAVRVKPKVRYFQYRKYFSDL